MRDHAVSLVEGGGWSALRSIQQNELEAGSATQTGDDQDRNGYREVVFEG